MTDYLNAESLIALLTLTALEVVLGIDNVIFIAIQAGNLAGCCKREIFPTWNDKFLSGCCCSWMVRLFFLVGVIMSLASREQSWVVNPLNWLESAF